MFINKCPCCDWLGTFIYIRSFWLARINDETMSLTNGLSSLEAHRFNFFKAEFTLKWDVSGFCQNFTYILSQWWQMGDIFLCPKLVSTNVDKCHFSSIMLTSDVDNVDTNVMSTLFCCSSSCGLKNKIWSGLIIILWDEIIPRFLVPVFSCSLFASSQF